MTDEWKHADIAAAGRSLYEEICGQLKETHKGKMFVVDVKSHDYEIGDNDLTATLRIIERRPNALTWGERVGYSAPYCMGGRELPALGPSFLEKLCAEFSEKGSSIYPNHHDKSSGVT